MIPCQAPFDDLSDKPSADKKSQGIFMDEFGKSFYHPIVRYADTLQKVLIENVMACRGSAARKMFAALRSGVRPGIGAIPPGVPV